MRARTLGLLSSVVTGAVVVVAVLAAPAGHHVVRREASRPVAAPHRCVTRALTVLGDWDRRRARAWTSGSADALSGLYVADSHTARRDVAMLGGYRAHGLRVRSMHRQVLTVHVRACRPRALSLLVTDRLVDAVAVGHGNRTGLPPGRPVTRRVDLRREAGRWRVSEVYAR
jgi:hypothetical protein